MKLLSQHIESLVFTSEKPIKLKEIKSILEESFETKFKNADLEEAIEEIQKRYEGEDFAFEMVAIAEGYQFLTKGSFFNTVATFLKQTTRKRLSRAALETLSIIAYKQPVTRSELERIRGVSCDYAIHKLLEKEMVTILGRSEAVGRPLLYGTSVKFMDYFGLKDLNDMPKPKDFKTAENSIGEAAPIEEDTPNPNQKPRLELPITDLEEVVDMIAAILPPGPKVEVPEEEIAEEQPSIAIVEKKELPHPANDLEEVVDMIVATLPQEPRPEIKTEVSKVSISKEVEAILSKQVANANPAKSDEGEQPKPAVVEQPKSINAMFQAAIAITGEKEETPIKKEKEVNETDVKTKKSNSSNQLSEVVDVVSSIIPQESESKLTPPSKSDKSEPLKSAVVEQPKSINTMFQAAIAITSEEKEAPIKEEKEINETVVKIEESKSSNQLSEVVDVVSSIIPQESESKLTPPSKSDEVEPPKPAGIEEPNSINAMFQAAVAIKGIEEKESESTSSDEIEPMSNELDEVVDVITATIPIENKPLDGIVLEELIKRENTSEEE